MLRIPMKLGAPQKSSWKHLRFGISEIELNYIIIMEKNNFVGLPYTYFQFNIIFQLINL